MGKRIAALFHWLTEKRRRLFGITAISCAITILIAFYVDKTPFGNLACKIVIVPAQLTMEIGGVFGFVFGTVCIAEIFSDFDEELLKDFGLMTLICALITLAGGVWIFYIYPGC